MNKALIAAVAAFSLSGCWPQENQFADQGCPWQVIAPYARLNSTQTMHFMGRINNALAHMSEDQIVTKVVNIYYRGGEGYYLLTDDCSIIPIEKELVDYGMGS